MLCIYTYTPTRIYDLDLFVAMTHKYECFPGENFRLISAFEH